jgi:hypothetical protein
MPLNIKYKCRSRRILDERFTLTSFLAIEHYSPLLVLITGLLTFIGIWGLGTLILDAVRLRLSAPWHQVTAILLGIQALSLSVQIAGIAGIAFPSVLRAIWWGLVCVGAAMLLLRWRASPAGITSRYDRSALTAIAIVGAAIVTNFLIAIAPSSKIDELYYHMLVPSRIVSDGSFHFYREPWQAAIWPQMVFQIAATPIHAMGYPDAVNVVSWALSATLLWFALQIIRANTKSIGWTALWVASLCVGIYPAVWHVTGGAHAMGDLAMATAIVALCGREQLLADLPKPAYSALLSILLLSAATSKVSLLPLSALLLCFAVCRDLWSTPPLHYAKIAFALAIPWLIFFCPIALWTWSQSGSPFGPMLADTLGPSIYPAGWAQNTFQATREANQPPLIDVAQYTAAGYSPMIWLGVIGAFFATTLSMTMRAILGSIFVLQCATIYSLLPHEARFLGGFHYGLVIAFATFVRPDIQARLVSARAVIAACVLFLLPWLGIQVYYAWQFFPASLGMEKAAFYERYIAFYADFVKLDRLLPKNVVLLVEDFRLDGVYAPRPVFFDPADLPKGKEAILFASPNGVASRSPKGYQLGKLIYENSQATMVTYRTPGRRSQIGPVVALQLIKSDKEPSEMDRKPF